MVQSWNGRSKIASAPRARRRLEARRLQILRAAGRTFRRRGFAAAGMRDIAAEADLSTGNLYHYFSGKHEILYFCQDRVLDVMLAAVRSTTRAERTPSERLRSVLAAQVRCMLDELEGGAAHLEVDSLPSPLRARIVRKRDRYEAGIRRLIAQGMAAGEFTPGKPPLLARAILGAVNWTARWFRPEGAQSAGAVADDLAQYLVRGLEARSGRARRGSAGATG